MVNWSSIMNLKKGWFEFLTSLSMEIHGRGNRLHLQLHLWEYMDTVCVHNLDCEYFMDTNYLSIIHGLNGLYSQSMDRYIHHPNLLMLKVFVDVCFDLIAYSSVLSRWAEETSSIMPDFFRFNVMLAGMDSWCLR